MSALERVARAAVRLRGRVFAGTSHKAAIMAAANVLRLRPATVWKSAGFGFVTTRGRWLSRAEAWVLAKKRGQLRWGHVRSGATPELHSEDLG